MLVDCPECSGRISSLADICPLCGYPLEELGFQGQGTQNPKELPAGPASEASETVQKNRFEGKFKKVFRELQIIREQTRLVSGWIFVTHQFSQEQLLKSEHFVKIDSIVKKIDDDAQNWFCSESSCYTAESIYRDMRKRVLSDIAEVKKDISDRPPTWWENILVSLKQFLLRFGI